MIRQNKYGTRRVDGVGKVRRIGLGAGMVALVVGILLIVTAGLDLSEPESMFTDTLLQVMPFMLSGLGLSAAGIILLQYFIRKRFY